MVGSSDSIACANIMLNAAMAETLKEFADKLEGVSDFETALHELIRSSIQAHKPLFSTATATMTHGFGRPHEERGLLNLRTTPDALATILDKKTWIC